MTVKKIRELQAERQKQEIAEADAETFFKQKNADKEYWRHFINKLLELRSEIEE